MPRWKRLYLPSWCREWLRNLQTELRGNMVLKLSKTITPEEFVTNMHRILPLDLHKFGKARGCSRMPVAYAPVHQSIIRVIERWRRRKLVDRSLARKLTRHQMAMSRGLDGDFLPVAFDPPTCFWDPPDFPKPRRLRRRDLPRRRFCPTHSLLAPQLPVAGGGIAMNVGNTDYSTDASV